MLKKKKYLFIYLCITLVFSLASAIMQTLMWRYIEPETELYVAGSAVPKIINWILAAMVLILLSSAFVFRKEKIKPMIAVNQLSVFSSSVYPLNVTIIFRNASRSFYFKNGRSYCP